MKILVTGASGFIGGNIVRILSQYPDHEIIATGRSKLNKSIDQVNVKYFVHDLSNTKFEFECDICIHCAGLADDNSPWNLLLASNVYATTNLLNQLINCKCFIYISSSSVYDFSNEKIKLEQDISESKKLSLYGQSKLLGEEATLKSKIESVYILRPRAVYGFGDRVLLPRIIKTIKKYFTVVPGNMEKFTSMTNIKNLCQAIEICIAQRKKGKTIYNIADGEPYQLNQIFKEISYLKSGHKRLIHIPLRFINFYLKIINTLNIKSNISRQSIDYLTQKSVISIVKAKTELNYDPKFTFEDERVELKATL